MEYLLDCWSDKTRDVMTPPWARILQHAFFTVTFHRPNNYSVEETSPIMNNKKKKYSLTAALLYPHH